MKKGFTLIELLVVVLIIGILAAIALPMYTRAVAKSRLAEPVTNLGTLQGAADRYIMERGVPVQYTDIAGDLDIAVPTSDRWTYTISAGGQDTAHIQVAPQSGQVLYVVLTASRNNAGAWTKTCTADTNSDADGMADYLCGSLEANGFQKVSSNYNNGTGGNYNNGTGGN